MRKRIVRLIFGSTPNRIYTELQLYRFFSLEMTIENPIGDREFTGSPRNGRHSLYPNGVSDVRLAAFDSYVKKEKAQIERNTRQQGLIPWRVNEQTVRELEAGKAKAQNDIDALLNKYDGNEDELNKYSREAKKLRDLREQLNQKQRRRVCRIWQGIITISQSGSSSVMEGGLYGPISVAEFKNGESCV